MTEFKTYYKDYPRQSILNKWKSDIKVGDMMVLINILLLFIIICIN
jgi:hypothetical protein